MEENEIVAIAPYLMSDNIDLLIESIDAIKLKRKD